MDRASDRHVLCHGQALESGCRGCDTNYDLLIAVASGSDNDIYLPIILKSC